VINNY